MSSDEPRRPWTQRVRRIVTGVPFLVTAVVIVLLAVAYTLAGFFLVPRLVKTYAPRYVQEQLKRRLEIGEVRVNPLLFKIEIKQLRLQEADGRPLLGFDRLFVDFELARTLFRRAWTLAEIQLEAPRLDVVMAKDGRLNLAELLDAFPKSEPAAQPDTAPRRMLLQHAQVSRGVVSFTDLSGRTPQNATIQPIDVELHNITTLPGRRGPYAISATLTGGGFVDWDGEVSLVPVGSTGHLGLRGFPLATAWRFAQDRLALAKPGGHLDAEARYQFAYRDGKTSFNVDGAGMKLGELVLTESGEKTPLLTLETIRVAGAHGDLIARELTVPEVTVSRGRLGAIIARDGTVNWQRLTATPPAAATAAPPPTPSVQSSTPAPERPWRVAVEKVRLEQIGLAFLDQSRATPLAVDVGDLAVDLSAKVHTDPAGVVGTVDGLGVNIGRVTVGPASGGKTPPLLSLDQVKLDGGRIDLGARSVAVSRVAVTGGGTTVVRAADGSIPALAMLAPVDGGKPQRAVASPPVRPRTTPASPAGAEKPWNVTVAAFEFGQHRLAVADRSVTPNVQLELSGIKLSARDVHTAGKKPIPFDAAFDVKQGGRFTAKGAVAPDGTTADASLNLARLALTPAQPYIASNAAVQLRSGDVSTVGRVTYRAGRDRPAVTYTGSVDVNGVNVVEAENGDPVIGWKAMHLDALRFGLAPDRLDVNEVTVTGMDGKVVIFKDRTLSLAKLMKPAGPAGAAPTGTEPAKPAAAATSPPAASTPPSTPPAASTAPSTPPAAADTATAPSFPVVVQRVRLEDSALDFADLSLVLPFAARVHGLNGVIVGLGSDPESQATVKLDGRVDEFGQMKVDGGLNAFRPKVFTDLAVIFRNVPMATLTPYSATFAGRRIVAGTLDVDLKYKIERSALVGENRVVLTKLQLGERVESPGAMRLPLDLAIAILSDSDGRIDIALPVRGNVDSPEFSYGHLIWQALVTVITKVVTSPFRALGALFGGEADAEKLQTIVFEPGSDVVQPPEREKLQRVADVLGKRGRLKLVVHGGYETKADGEALRSLRVRQDLAQRLGVTVKPGQDPGPVAFDQVKTQRALEAMLTERAGGKAVEELHASFEKSAGRKVERANPVLAVVGRGSGDRAFYEALFRRLVETAPLGETDVAALGQRRGEAIARVLKERAGNVADRVEIGDTRAAEHAEKNAVPTRLELGAVGA